MKLQWAPSIQSTELVFLAEEKFSLADLSLDENTPVFFDSGLGKVWQQKLTRMGFSEIYSMPTAEAAKDWQVVGAALEFLGQRAHERRKAIVVVGGGAVCDSVSMVASLYKRGIPVILVPTTLLSMVDAAIGGKTAVNLKIKDKVMKNLAGSFYPAKKICFWSHWLESLAKEERRSGLGELLKSLLLKGTNCEWQNFVAWIDSAKCDTPLWSFVEEAIAYKSSVVQADPLDNQRIRECLNYGHSVGHALESICAADLKHGEAVMLGMLLETAFFAPDSALVPKIRDFIFKLHFPIPRNSISAAQILPYLRNDKKMREGKLELSVLVELGKVQKFQVNPFELAEFSASYLKVIFAEPKVPNTFLDMAAFAQDSYSDV